MQIVMAVVCLAAAGTAAKDPGKKCADADSAAKLCALGKQFFSCFLTFLLPIILAARSTASEWPEVRIAGPFIIRADYPLKNGESFLNGLSSLHKELDQTLRLPRPKTPIEVYLLHDEATYRRYLQRLYPQLRTRQAFYIQEKGMGRLFARAGPQLETDVRHEAVHALLHAGLAYVPLWLDEGLATYFELPPPKRIQENPYLTGLEWNLYLGVLPKLERLESLENPTTMSKGDYRDCWAWTHFLLHGPPAARDELFRYLRDLKSPPMPSPLSRRLARNVPDLQQQLKTHLLTLGKIVKSK
jgi:hypothetical protein